MRLIFLLLFAVAIQSVYAQVAVNNNGNTPAPSSMLDVSSTNKGMLMPRMTSTQRKAISNPDGGLIVYDTDKQTLYMFDGHQWRPLMFTTDGNLPLIERDIPGAGNDMAKLGFTVAIDGNTAAAFLQQSRINGLSYAGAVSIFSKESGQWNLVTTLIPPTPQSEGYFGTSLSLKNDVLVVGEPGFDKPGKADAGIVHIYKKAGNNWNLIQDLTPSAEMAGAAFGVSVSIDNGRIAVGANGQTVSGVVGAGAVYVFKLNGAVYTEEKYITVALNGGGNLGKSVSLSGNNLLAGAPTAKQGSVKCGAAVLHTLAQNTQQWTYAGTWWPTNIHENLNFGSALGILNDRAIVGAYGYTYSGENHGRVELYKKSGNSWINNGSVSGSTDSWFGYSVSLSETQFMVASPSEKDGRVRIYNESGSELRVLKDNLATEGVKGFAFGHSVAMSGQEFIIGMPNKKNQDIGVVQFGQSE